MVTGECVDHHGVVAGYALKAKGSVRAGPRCEGGDHSPAVRQGHHGIEFFSDRQRDIGDRLASTVGDDAVDDGSQFHDEADPVRVVHLFGIDLLRSDSVEKGIDGNEVDFFCSETAQDKASRGVGLCLDPLAYLDEFAAVRDDLVLHPAEVQESEKREGRHLGRNGNRQRSRKRGAVRHGCRSLQNAASAHDGDDRNSFVIGRSPSIGIGSVRIARGAASTTLNAVIVPCRPRAALSDGVDSFVHGCVEENPQKSTEKDCDCDQKKCQDGSLLVCHGSGGIRKSPCRFSTATCDAIRSIITRINRGKINTNSVPNRLD